MAGNPDSKRGRVHACYDAKGEAAAAALGASLGVGNGRLKRWFGLWSGNKPEPKRKPNLSAPAPILRPRKTEGKVALAWREEYWGTVLEKSETETKVMWPNGNINVVPNEWVKPL